MDYDNNRILELKNISLTLGKRRILKNIKLTLNKGTITIIIGKSGSGKSTLLNVMNMLCVPDEGEYFMNGIKVDFYNEEMTADLRSKIGFFHQELALLEGLSVCGNMEIFSKVSQKQLNKMQLKKYLKLLELEKVYASNVSVLSGGERQRAAFLKLLILPYDFIFIDEPTNNLDHENIEVIKRGINGLKEQGKTVVVVSHYTPLREIADKTVELEEING